MNNQFKDEIKEIDIKIIGVYLLIASSLLYLVIFYKNRAEIIDKYIGSKYAKSHPNTNELPKIIAIILLIANSIFLYYSYKSLKESIDEYKKTGNKTSLDTSYNYFYANILQFSASLIVAYNIFVKGASNISVIR